MRWNEANASACLVKLTRSGRVFTYLHDQLGFEKSLTGNGLAREETAV